MVGFTSKNLRVIKFNIFHEVQRGSYQQHQEPAIVRAPIKDPKDPRGFTVVNLEVLDPHVIINYLFDECKVELPDDSIKAFWDHHHSVQSPWLEQCDATRQHIPIGLYADGARCRQQAFRPVEKVFGIFISLPLWRPRSSRLSRWLLFSIDESLLHERKTLNCVWRRIAWSINSMFWGRYPLVDPEGKRLCGPNAGKLLTKNAHCFAFTELRGDWSFFKLIFGFNSSWKGGTNLSVCYQCCSMGTGQPGTRYFEVAENSPSWGNMFNKVQFLVQQMPQHDVCNSFLFWGMCSYIFFNLF